MISSIGNKLEPISNKVLWAKSIFICLLLAHTVFGFYKLMYLDGGSDNQWYGAKLYWSGINPYVACLETPKSGWFMTSFPNYAPLLYIILWPLTLMSWKIAKFSWFLLSLFSFIWSLHLFWKKEGIRRNMVLLVASIALVGSTFSTTLSLGQISIIVFALLTTAWVYRKNTIVLIICLTLIFPKYTFGIPILAGFFLAGYFKESILALLINLLAYMIFAIQFDMNFIKTIMLPLQVANQHTSFGYSDLISLNRVLFPRTSIFDFNLFTITTSIIYMAFAIISFLYKPSTRTIVVSSILFSFALFFHLDYDYIVLLVPLMLAYIHPRLRTIPLIITTGLMAYLWLFPLVPRLIRIIFGIQTGRTPLEWFGQTGGMIFIGFNAIIIIVLGFYLLLSKNEKLSVSHSERIHVT